MAIRVGTGQTTQVKAVRAAGSTTVVKKIIVGRPIAIASSGTTSINSLIGVNTSGRSQGALLVYNAVTSDFEVTTTLDDINQTIDGGTF